MHVAYLFAETCPNYDLDLRLFRGLTPDDLKSLNTRVRTGVWEFSRGMSGHVSRDDIARRLFEVLYAGWGNICRMDVDLLLQAILEKKLIYTVQFASVGHSLAGKLDRQLQALEGYFGFTQVVPTVPVHRQVFGSCLPRYQVEEGNIFVLYSDLDEDELQAAEQIVKWWKEHSKSLDQFHLGSSLSTRNIGPRYSIYDSQEDPMKELAVEIAAQQLGNEWEVQCERTLYALQERVPDALNEFLAATEILSKSELSPADGAQVAVNLRRTLEHLTRFVCPPSKESPGWVKRQWREYREQHKKKLGKYGDFLAFEAFETNGSIDILEAMCDMGNKGVHEDWDPLIFRGIVLRLLLLMDAVLSLKSGHRKVKLDSTFFDIDMVDE